MRLAWGQGKIEVVNRHQEILDFLAAGWTAHQIFRRLKAEGLQAGRTTFYRTIQSLMTQEQAEQPSAALPVVVSKAQRPKVPDKRSEKSSAPPAVQSGADSPAVKPQGKARSELEMSGYQRLSFTNEELFGEDL